MLNSQGYSVLLTTTAADFGNNIFVVRYFRDSRFGFSKIHSHSVLP